MRIEKIDNCQVLRVRFPGAQEVFAVGRFNHWSTVDTPLVNLGDGFFEVALPPGTELRDLCFFVWDLGQHFGRILHGDSPNGPAV